MGGQLRLAEKPPHKERLAWCYEDLEYQARNNGAEILCNTSATSELVESYKPYAVIIATGAYAFKPHIPGADADYVTTVTPILDGSLKLTGQHIAVVGSGMTGIETAELLVTQGNRVTVIEMADKIAPGTFNIGVWDVMQTLDNGKTVFLPGRKLDKIENHELTLVKTNDEREIVQVDTVVLSLGSRSNKSVAEELEGCCDKLYIIGDADKAGRIKDAIHGAFALARELS